MLSISISFLYLCMNIFNSKADSIKNTYSYSNKYSDFFLSNTNKNLESNKYLTLYTGSYNNINSYVSYISSNNINTGSYNFDSNNNYITTNNNYSIVISPFISSSRILCS